MELKIKLAQRHAHARRYFKDVEEANPEDKEYLEFYKELSLFEKLAALMYTIIESCKKFEIDLRQYILETLKASAAKQKTLTPYKFALKLRSQQPA